MLTTNILLAEKYDYLSEKFKKAFTFLRDTDLAALPVGNVLIDGNEVYANVQSYSKWMLQIVRLKVIKNTSMYNM